MIGSRGANGGALVAATTSCLGRMSSARRQVATTVLAAQARELDELRARLGSVEDSQREVARLRQERTQILAQVESILKELEALELP